MKAVVGEVEIIDPPILDFGLSYICYKLHALAALAP
jgi:hypothetical protein